MDRHTLARGLRTKCFPFGVYIPPEKGTKGAYLIIPERLFAYLRGDDMRPLCPYASAASDSSDD
jgi:hypothetical protein